MRDINVDKKKKTTARDNTRSPQRKQTKGRHPTRNPATREEIERAAESFGKTVNRALKNMSDRSDVREGLLQDKRFVKELEQFRSMLHRTMKPVADSTVRRYAKDIRSLSRHTENAQQAAGDTNLPGFVQTFDRDGKRIEVSTLNVLDGLDIAPSTKSSYYAMRAAIQHGAKQAIDELHDMLYGDRPAINSSKRLRLYEGVHLLRVQNACAVLRTHAPDRTSDIRERIKRASGFKDRGIHKDRGLSAKFRKKKTATILAKHPELAHEMMQACIEDIDKRVADPEGLRRRGNKGHNGGRMHNLLLAAPDEFQMIVPTMTLTGCRPKEAFHGLTIDFKDDTWRFLIKGAKITENAGQPERIIEIEHNDHFAPLKTMLDLARDQGRLTTDENGQLQFTEALQIDMSQTLDAMDYKSEDARKDFSKWYSRLANKVAKEQAEKDSALKTAMKRLKNPSFTPYCSRHVFSSELKESWRDHFPDDDRGAVIVSEALGHRTERMKSHYGSRNQASKSGPTYKTISASEPVKRMEYYKDDPANIPARGGSRKTPKR